MVIDTDGYIHIIGYLTENLSLFENTNDNGSNNATIMEIIEQELTEQIISVCGQNSQLTFNQRNTIIREVDAIVTDLEELLAGIMYNPATSEQREFLKEFALIIKNLFDSEVHSD